MKLVFTNESIFLVNNVKNLLETQKIEVFIKNEYAQGAIGEISPFDSWPELWVVNDSDFDRSKELISTSQQSKSAEEWLCKHCSEKNDASFELCWKCQLERS